MARNEHVDRIKRAVRDASQRADEDTAMWGDEVTPSLDNETLDERTTTQMGNQYEPRRKIDTGSGDYGPISCG